MINMLPIAILAIAIMAIVFWCTQISAVINRPDNTFKGTHDKWMWFIVVVVLGPVGAWLYWVNKPLVPPK